MEKDKIKILIIAYWFSVENAATGQVQRHFIQNLVKHGFLPTVICAHKRNVQIINDVRIIGVPESRFLKFVLKVISRTPLGPFLKVPDMIRLSWNRKVIKNLKTLLKDSHFDYVHTINNPSSSHLIGLKIKQTYGIPWIAQFYDPWTNNPVECYATKKIKNLNFSLEYEVAKNADVILHTNELMIKYWKKLYGDTVYGKIYRLNLLTEVKTIDINSSHEKLIISHIGHFTDYRNSLSFIEAVNTIKIEKPHLLKKLEVNYIGLVTEQERSLINRYDLTDVFQLYGRLVEKDCIPFFEKSSIFLVIDTCHNPNVFFPSKILKYFFYKKPILGITTHDSVLKEELINSKNICFEYGEIKAIAQFLICQLESSGIYNKQDTEYWKKFSPDIVIDRYKQIIGCINKNVN